MCRIARYTIGNYPYCQNIHNQIDGGAFAFSSSPRLITLYTSCKRGQNRGHYNVVNGFVCEKDDVLIPIWIIGTLLVIGV